MKGSILKKEYNINKNYVINEVGKKATIFEPTGQEVYILEDVEYSILKMFDGTRSVESIIKQLKVDYAVTDIEPDVTAFVGQLIEKGVLCCYNDA